MLAVARAYMPTREDAEDVLVSAFPLVLRYIDRFDGALGLSGWLDRIVVNCSRMRRLVSDRRPGERVNLWTLEAACVADPSRAGSPPEAIANGETDPRLVQAVGRVPDIVRAAVRLREMDVLSLTETARLLGQPAGRDHARVQRGRIALRSILSSRTEGP